MQLPQGLTNQRGAVMVEFALVATLLILLLAGIIQFGLIFNVQLSLENASQQGARMASLSNNTSDTAVRNAISDALSDSLHLDPANLDISISPSTRRPGQPVNVIINYTYQVPFTLGVLPESYDLHASAVMVQN